MMQEYEIWSEQAGAWSCQGERETFSAALYACLDKQAATGGRYQVRMFSGRILFDSDGSHPVNQW